MITPLHNTIEQATPTAPRSTGSGLVLKVTIIIVLLISTGFADRITLRDGAQVTGSSITLGDIAQLEGDYANGLAETQIATFADASASATITRRQVQQVLDGQGVHWGRVSLRGHLKIQVERAGAKVGTAKTAPAHETIVEDANVHANTAPGLPGADIADAGRTLRQIALAYLVQHTGAKPTDMKIKWHHDRSPVWQRSEAEGRFEVVAQNRDIAGRIPLVVRQYKNDQLIDTLRLGADVELRSTVVVATQRITRGQTITGQDIKTEERWLDSGRQRPLTDADALIGQVAARSIRDGQLLTPNDVKPALMVKRGQLITLRAISGGLIVKTVARAMDDGGDGQIIKVRNLRTREQYHVRVSGPQQAVMLISESQATQDKPGGTS
jgi:flagella basal body P-ring formation protein FlgA